MAGAKFRTIGVKFCAGDVGVRVIGPSAGGTDGNGSGIDAGELVIDAGEVVIGAGELGTGTNSTAIGSNDSAIGDILQLFGASVLERGGGAGRIGVGFLPAGPRFRRNGASE